MRTPAKVIAGAVLLASCSPNVLVGVDPCLPETAGCPRPGADAGADQGNDNVRPVHRYSFDGTGTTVLDSIGTAHGTVVGAELTGLGTLTVMNQIGDPAQYVDLPRGLLRELRDATFEVWVSWAGSAARDGTRTPWQRIFDFGEGSTGIDGEQASGADPRSYLFLTPQTAPRTATEEISMRVAYQVPHVPQSVTLETVVNTAPLPIDVDTHVGVTVDARGHRMSLFVNGAIVGAADLTQDNPLSYIYDINNWLGRSQFPADVGFTGTYLELRIYPAALTAGQIRASYDAGPDAAL